MIADMRTAGTFVGKSVNTGNTGIASTFQYTDAQRVRPQALRGNPNGKVCVFSLRHVYIYVYTEGIRIGFEYMRETLRCRMPH